MRYSILAICLALPATSLAAGTSLPVHGVRDLGMGGAHTAGAAGYDALWHNPALLGDTSVGLSLSFVDLEATYTRDGATSEEIGSPVPNPQFGAVWRINEMFSVGIGAYAPFGAQYKFDEGGPQRYALVENDKNQVLFMALAVAFRLDGLSVGASVQNVYARIKQRSVLSGYSGLFGFEEDPELDVLSELELDDPFTITGNVGAAYDYGDFTFAASVQLPYTIAGDAKFRNRLPSSVFFDAAELEGETAYLEIPHPWIVRTGIQWRPSDTFFVEGSVKWEDWSTQQRLVLDPKGRITLHGVPGVGDYVMKPIIVDRRMRDTFSAHIGGDLEVLSNLHMRGGVFWEQSAFGDETFSVATLDDEKIGLSLGASWYFSTFRFDVGIARVFQGTREVTTSELTQVNPTNQAQAAVIGNGTYTSNFWTGGAGVAWIYD